MQTLQDKLINFKYRVLDEGLDYTIMYYSSWEDINDPEFQKMLHEYRSISNRINRYIKSVPP